ncbi:odorant receptor 13a-like [Phymastichus coffea]|uniref:odorant receptor 13a-like n=1 Tax=Phymastichus coffea TaxID=108790 RepID=UPI00273CA724|nr:odorant receptor 13a-like [Phymastichus coffea]
MSWVEGFDTEIGPSRKVMYLLGIYPDPKKKLNWITRGYFLLPATIMLYFCNIPQSVTAVKVCNDLDAVLEVLTTSDISVAIALFKHLDICYNADVLNQLVLSMFNDWTSPKTNKELLVMWKNARRGRLMSIIIILLAEGTVIAYFVAAVYFNYNAYARQTNPENNVTEKFRPLYLKADFFYDVQKSPVFEITWIFQCFSTIFAASSFSAVDAFFAVLVLHLCGQLNNLKENLKSLLLSSVNIDNVESYSENLVHIIARHQYLDSFARNIEDAFNVMFLVQMVVSSLVLCLQGYQLVTMITTEDGILLFDLIFMIYFTLCFMFSLFVYCYVAEVLRKESMEIGDVAYEIGWYNLSAAQTKPLIMIMLRAKQPFQITAGKFVNFSLELYCKILKTSGGYLSMLLAMKDRL